MLRQEGRAGACGHGEESVLFLSELRATEDWRQRKDRIRLGFYQDLSGCLWKRGRWQVMVEQRGCHSFHGRRWWPGLGDDHGDGRCGPI